MKHTQGQWTRYQESRNLQTRKHPRTMQEAFGPYTSAPLEEPSDPWDWQDAVVICGCAAAAVIVVVLQLF